MLKLFVKYYKLVLRNYRTNFILETWFFFFFFTVIVFFIRLQPNAQYQFSFDISDDESTNYHNRKEQRDGEKISGSYSVVDSDGFIRTVTYTADPEEVRSYV